MHGRFEDRQVLQNRLVKRQSRADDHHQIVVGRALCDSGRPGENFIGHFRRPRRDRFNVGRSEARHLLHLSQRHLHVIVLVKRSNESRLPDFTNFDANNESRVRRQVGKVECGSRSCRLCDARCRRCRRSCSGARFRRRRCRGRDGGAGRLAAGVDSWQHRSGDESAAAWLSRGQRCDRVAPPLPLFGACDFHFLFTVRLKRLSRRALNPLQIPRHIDAAVRVQLQSDRLGEVGFRLVDSSQPVQREATEVVSSRILTALLHDFVQNFLSLCELTSEIRRSALRVHRVQRLRATGRVRTETLCLFRLAPIFFEHQPRRPLNPFERTRNVASRCPIRFKPGSLFEIRPGIIAASQGESCQAAEVVNPRVRRVRLNQFGEQRLGLRILLRVISRRGFAVRRDLSLSLRHLR